MSEIVEFPLPTLGSGPLWEEIAVVGEFRIERNRVTGIHRLLDAALVRRAWGDQEACENVLARLLSAPHEPNNPNLRLPTLGGMQFWADELVRCGWRIQRNVFSGHCRLLDAGDIRQAWGTFEQCEVAMRRLHEAAGIEPVSERIVVLVHGILGWKDRWGPMTEALRREGYEVVDVNYPSTRGCLSDHASQLAQVIENLPEHEEINFVCHSMGGLIVRRLLGDNDEIEPNRIVMIATPNQGAVFADLCRDIFAYRLVFGPSGQELITGVNAVCASLPIPECEFGNIAGGGHPRLGGNPLIEGDDDGFVEISSTHLEGERDFLLVPEHHGAIIRNPTVIQATINFLRHGRFAD